MTNHDRRSVLRKGLVRTLEIGGALGIGFGFVRNAWRTSNSYVIDTSKAIMSERPSVVFDFANHNLALSNSLGGLYSAYRSAYLDEGTIDIGDISIPYSNWNVPKGLPNRTKVYGARDNQSRLSGLAEFLKHETLIDRNLVGVLKVKEEEMGMAGRILGHGTAGLILAGVALGYEEMVAAVTMGGSVKETNTSAQISRRSLIKILAAGCSAVVANKVADSNSRTIEEQGEELGDGIKKLSREQEESSEQSFKKYFGIGREDFISNVSGVLVMADDALKHGIHHVYVKDAFTKVRDAAQAYQEFNKKNLSEGVPQELGYAADCAIMTNKLRELSEQSEGKTGTGIAKLFGLTALTVAGVIIPLEIVNSKLAKRDRKRIYCYK